MYRSEKEGSLYNAPHIKGRTRVPRMWSSAIHQHGSSKHADHRPLLSSARHLQMGLMILSSADDNDGDKALYRKFVFIR